METSYWERGSEEYDPDKKFGQSDHTLANISGMYLNGWYWGRRSARLRAKEPICELLGSGCLDRLTLIVTTRTGVSS